MSLSAAYFHDNPWTGDDAADLVDHTLDEYAIAIFFNVFHIETYNRVTEPFSVFSASCFLLYVCYFAQDCQGFLGFQLADQIQSEANMNDCVISQLRLRHIGKTSL